MYRTPLLKSEQNKKENPYEKGAKDPSLPRSPDFPEVGIKDFNETTAGNIWDVEKLTETPAYSQSQKSSLSEYSFSSKRNNKVAFYGKSDMSVEAASLWKDTPSSVNSNTGIWAGYRIHADTDNYYNLSFLMGAELLRPYYSGFVQDSQDPRGYDFIWTFDPYDTSTVWSYDGHSKDMYIGSRKAYTRYARVYIGTRVTYIEVVVEGRQAVKMPNITMYGFNPQWVMTQPPPGYSSDVAYPEENNDDYEIYYGVIDDFGDHDNTYENAGIVIKNYSAFPRLFKMAEFRDISVST